MKSPRDQRWRENRAAGALLPDGKSPIELAMALNAFTSVADVTGETARFAVGVKDLIDVAGMVTTGGGWQDNEERCSLDADVVAAVLRSGGRIIGKTNLDEWAMGATGENSRFGRIANPWDASRTAGGSSGGSAVAVATGACDWAIGTDTGGSIRIPAALCGVVGMKPSQKLISTRGIVPLSPSLDTVGPLAPDVERIAIALSCMSGHNMRLPAEGIPLESLALAAVHEGWLSDRQLDPEIQDAWDAVREHLPTVMLPNRLELVEIQTTVMKYEAARIHRALCEQRAPRYSAPVAAQLAEGWAITDQEYRNAVTAGERARRDVAARMAGWDAVLLPTTAITAPRFDDIAGVRPMLNGFTRPFNVTGQPAISVPYPSAALPVGIQIVGREGDDAKLLQVAAACELEWWGRRPGGLRTSAAGNPSKGD